MVKGLEKTREEQLKSLDVFSLQKRLRRELSMVYRFLKSGGSSGIGAGHQQ